MVNTALKLEHELPARATEPEDLPLKLVGNSALINKLREQIVKASPQPGPGFHQWRVRQRRENWERLSATPKKLGVD